MTALCIVSAIALLLFILLRSPFRICVSCRENKPSVVLKYLFFKRNIYPASEKKSAKKKSSLSKSSKKNDAEKSDGSAADNKKKTKKKKSTLPEKKEDKLAFIINILKSSGKALKHFTKRITITKVTADIDISDEDACDCAIKFGKANIAVYNILSFASVFFKVKKEHICINCVYNKPESVYNFSFTVKFTPFAGILSAIAFIITFFVNNKKAYNNQKP